jgi:hypothetical protein
LTEDWNKSRKDGKSPPADDPEVVSLRKRLEKYKEATGGYKTSLALYQTQTDKLHSVIAQLKDFAEAEGTGASLSKADLAKVLVGTWYAGKSAAKPAFRIEPDGTPVAEYIRERGGKITARDLNKNNRQFQTTEAAESGLDDLVRAGFGHWQDSPAGPRGGRPTRVFCLGGVGETYPRIAT